MFELSRVWEGRQYDTYAIPDEAEAGAAEELDELRVKLVVGVPWAARHFDGRIEVV